MTESNCFVLFFAVTEIYANDTSKIYQPDCCNERTGERRTRINGSSCAAVPHAPRDCSTCRNP